MANVTMLNFDVKFLGNKVKQEKTLKEVILQFHEFCNFWDNKKYIAIYLQTPYRSNPVMKETQNVTLEFVTSDHCIRQWRTLLLKG